MPLQLCSKRPKVSKEDGEDPWDWAHVIFNSRGSQNTAIATTIEKIDSLSLLPINSKDAWSFYRELWISLVHIAEQIPTRSKQDKLAAFVQVQALSKSSKTVKILGATHKMADLPLLGGRVYKEVKSKFIAQILCQMSWILTVCQNSIPSS
jgi:hypothetical protein